LWNGGRDHQGQRKPLSLAPVVPRLRDFRVDTQIIHDSSTWCKDFRQLGAKRRDVRTMWNRDRHGLAGWGQVGPGRTAGSSALRVNKKCQSGQCAQ
jgi:hypothetical protein